MEQAKKVVVADECGYILLSKEETEWFVRSLEAPFAPNARLEKALNRIAQV
jgi:uncharacterized protein (DUF1778 family)